MSKVELYSKKIVDNTTAVAISTDAGDPTLTPAFADPHKVKSFLVKATTANSAAVVVQLKVGDAQAGPFAIPLDKAGVPVPALSFASSSEALLAGPGPSEFITPYRWGRYELVKSGTTFTLKDFTIVLEAE